MSVLGATLGPSWPFLGHLGRSEGHLGVILALLGALLGPSWGHLGHIWALTCMFTLIIALINSYRSYSYTLILTHTLILTRSLTFVTSLGACAHNVKMTMLFSHLLFTSPSWAILGHLGHTSSIFEALYLKRASRSYAKTGLSSRALWA